MKLEVLEILDGAGESGFILAPGCDLPFHTPPENLKVVSISGGSIFCKCLVTDFMNQLQRIHQGDVAFGAPPDGLVIEASVDSNIHLIDYSGGRCTAQTMDETPPAKLGLACITRGDALDRVKTQFMPLFRTSGVPE